jgi:hypothetical protein
MLKLTQFGKSQSYMAGFLFLALTFTSHAWAGSGRPFYLILGVATIPANSTVRFEYGLNFNNTAGMTVDFTASTQYVNTTNVPAEFTDSSLARSIADTLNSDTRVNGEYDFRVERTARGDVQVTGIPKMNRTPTVNRGGVVLRRVAGMIVSTGIDPRNGDAMFDVEGTASTSSGQVFLGVNGFVFDTPTSDQSGPKSPQAIKTDLMTQLVMAGFVHAFIDPSSGMLTVPGVSSGDPPNRDLGALVMTTDPGLTLTAQMSASMAENRRPPRGTVDAPTRAPAGSMITVSISRFPANSSIDITVSGKSVGTIMTNGNGTGMVMITLPNGPKGIPLEIKGTGGNPVVFGYGWITLTD